MCWIRAAFRGLPTDYTPRKKKWLRVSGACFTGRPGLDWEGQIALPGEWLTFEMGRIRQTERLRLREAKCRVLELKETKDTISK